MTRGRTRAARAAAAAALAASLGCAAVEAPPPGPPPFRGVRSLVLVRRVDPGDARGRDPLDALRESLAARGYAARIAEVGPGGDGDARDLERLHERVAARLSGRGRFTGRAERLDAESAAVVARLGVDAVVGYHRLADVLPPLPPLPDPLASPFARRPYAAARPTGALSLVAADGSAAWFPWGAGGPADGRALLNAAEGIDALLAALAGEAFEGTQDEGP